MALKAIMLRRSIEKKQAELEALRQKDAEFSKREAELETAINEAETSEQEQAVTEEVEAFDADKTAHEAKRLRWQARSRALKRSFPRPRQLLRPEAKKTISQKKGRKENGNQYQHPRAAHEPTCV